MDPTKFFGANIFEVLALLRNQEKIVEYSKIEGDEYLMLKELGFYLHSKNGNEIIFDCRIYFKAIEDYFSSKKDIRGKYSSIITISELEYMLGNSGKDIKSIKIPTRPNPLGGKEYFDGLNKIKAFNDDFGEIIYMHIIKSS